MKDEEKAKEIVRLAVKDHDEGGYQEAGINEIMANRIAAALKSCREELSQYCEHQGACAVAKSDNPDTPCFCGLDTALKTKG